MGKRVLVAARDLFFRSKLTAVVQAAGAELTRDDAACDLAVVELGPADVVERIRALAGAGGTGAGVRVARDAERAARRAGRGGGGGGELRRGGKTQETAGRGRPRA